ncbi:hypothetical protein HMPREF1863_01196 [Aedoeadaptatus coxii]|uniref:Uncharacterized protein n=1 Tax=Aedoeadaptatus coxii TaxID=755172 RepID=A0A134AE94_9FIRM|nr:hypothetical protein HMPREF1863_01196 [Peptoniphilus coxii]
MGRAGKRETRPLPLSPFPLPRDMVFGLYETQLTSRFMCAYFLKFILINIPFERKEVFYPYPFLQKSIPIFLKITIIRNIIGVDDVGIFESVRR